MSGQDEQGKIDSAAFYIKSKGVDKKEDTIMMLMAPEANWDQFFTPAPFAIALLEDLIIISAGTDFSLEEKPPKAGFKHLRYPHSFRASLVQVSNSIWDAYSEAHTSMDRIRLHSLNVDTHVKNALKFLLKGSPEEVELMLPLSLNKIDKIANEILQPPLKIIENHFVFVMQLTAELLEACTNTIGVYDSKAKEEAVHKEQKAMKDRLEKMEKDVTEAQVDFQDAVKSLPSGENMLFMSAADAMIETVRNINFVSVVKEVVKKKACQLFLDDSDTEDEDESPENLDISMSKRNIYIQIGIISKHINQLAQIVRGSGDAMNPKPDFTAFSKDQSVKEIEQILNRCQNNVDREETKYGELSKQVSQFCVKGKQICEKMISMTTQIRTENNEDKIASISEEVNSLRNDLEKRAVVASRKLGKNPLDNKPPHLAKMPTQSKSVSSVQAARKEARFKVDLAKETLKDIKQRQDKAFEELKETNDRLTEVLKEMGTLDTQKIDFDIFRDKLVKCIKALLEQWGKLVRFFHMLSNFIKCCIHSSLKDFVDTVDIGRQLSSEGKPLSDIYRDVIFEQATQANKVVYVVHIIAKTYVQVSEQHLMDRITCLGQLSIRRKMNMKFNSEDMLCTIAVGKHRMP